MTNNINLSVNSFDGNLKDVYEYHNKEAGTYTRDSVDSNSWEKEN